MNKKNKEITPFIHFDLEYKNQLLEYARSLKHKKQSNIQLEIDLASAVIYASFAEYIASYLLNNLRHLSYMHTYFQSGAVAFSDQRKAPLDKPISYFIEELKNFDFPDRKEFIELLSEVKKCRNELFHNFARGNKEDLKQVGANIKSIQNGVEQLVTKINVINPTLTDFISESKSDTK